MKKLIKAIGIKDYLIYLLLMFLEIILNLPYKIIKFILFIPYKILELLFDKCFYKDNLYPLTKIKIIRNYVYNWNTKIKEYCKNTGKDNQ